MNIKTIPLKSLQDALMMAVIKQKRARNHPGSTPQARIAAFTDQPSTFAPSCRSKRRCDPLEPIHCGFMSHGDLQRVVVRVHYEHGPKEVRHIWGIGLRAMQSEIAAGSLR